MKVLLSKVRETLRKKKTRKILSRYISILSAVIVFITTYALILPAITLELKASCGIEEHQHNDECYEERLICGQEEGGGHHHDDSCYEVRTELDCEIEEHQHSAEDGCYDADGNLICKLKEHVHDDSCYRNVKTLVCEEKESDGHHHTDACYEKVLVCGKEAHIHSEACYKDVENAGDSNAEASDQASSVTIPEDSDGEQAAETLENTETTETTVEEILPENYVPEMEQLNMEAMFGKETGFYYYHAEDGQEDPSNSAEITDWQKVKEDTELTPTDLVKIYLPYTIPAGSLNETNPTARYRLPGNIHLSDEQIEAINKNENGIASGFSKIDPEYKMYLGAEAIEGNRTPDELLQDGALEYISAVVRAENVYEDDEFLGQDLIFTFVPYTIEKNQTTYDAEHNPVSAGEKVTGWFACDFRLEQIDWIEDEVDEEDQDKVEEETQEEKDQSADDTAVTTIEKTADILFVTENKDEYIEEIKCVLKLIEKKEDVVSEENETEEETTEFQSGTLTADGDGYKITLDYTAEAKIPENASLSVREITAETDKEAYEVCLAQAQQHVDESGEAKSTVDSRASRFFDIEIQVTYEDGTTQKIEPAAPVSVNIQIANPPEDKSDSDSGSKEAQTSDPTVLHFAEEGVEQIEATSESAPVDGGSEDTSSDSKAAEVRFEAESFSIYGVVYTVDFHYGINGKMYEFSIPGGGYATLQQLVEVLGIANSDTNSTNASDSARNSGDFQEEDDEYNAGQVPGVENGAYGRDESGSSDNVEEEPGVGSSDAQDNPGSGSHYEGATTLNNVSVSEKTREFVADVANVEFSNPDLVWVGKVDETATVGGLKEANGLECEYSTELTEEQIAETNSSTVEAGDWALISVQPFSGKENLTVTMSNGDRFTILVTDAQISTNVLTVDGKTFKITVSFDDTAEIPAGTKLVAEEIAPDSDEYIQYLGRTWAELNKDYLRRENQKKQNHHGPDDIVDIRPVNIDRAHFFDVAFVYDEEKIEPKAPVYVDIQLINGLSNSADVPITGVVHFPQNYESDAVKTNNLEIELIKDFKSVEDVNGSIIEYSYELDSFSTIGAYLGQKTEEVGISPQDPAITLPKLTALRAGESMPTLNDLVASKTLTPNMGEGDGQPDGTYTLSLSVKGDAAQVNQITKANVLIVMDRSTSMRETVTAGIPYTGQLQQGSTYYGFVNNDLVTLNYSAATGQLTYTLENGETGVYEGTVYVNSTRLVSEQAALDELIGALVAKNNLDGVLNTNDDDIIEVNVTSFASARGSSLNGAATAYDNTTQGHPVWSGTTESGWKTSYGEGSTLYSAVHNTSINNGTNWEDALMYAKQTADTMKQAQPDEDVYIIFLTDGEPTAIYGEKSQDFNGWGARHYENTNSGTVGGGSIYALDYAKHDDRSEVQSEYGNDWDVQDIVNEGYKFFSIFTFNNSDRYSQYLKHLVNYAYGIDSYDSDPERTADTPTSDAFYMNARNVDELRNSFDSIFSSILDSVAHGDVTIVDGLTTDSMSTNIVDGQADGVRYKVEDGAGNLVYSVTASGSNTDPKVIFTIGNGNYTYDPASENNQVRKITTFTDSSTTTEGETITKTDVSTTVTVGGGKTTVVTNTIVSTSVDNGETYTITSNTKGTPVVYNSENAAVSIPEGAKIYYSVSIGGIEYRMALADSVTMDPDNNPDPDNNERTLTWDLSPIGALKKDYTYTAEIVVWPNQDAYDYVAGLNNFPDVEDDEFEWDDEKAVPVYDESDPPEILYYKGGVEEYPSIVKYPGENGVFSVLSNTKQEVYYSDVYTQSTNDVITTETKVPHEKDLELPDPMDLLATETELEKEWSVDRNPALMAQFLYDSDGNSKEFAIEYGIYCDGDDDDHLYTKMTLGWDGEKYVWKPDSVRYVRYNGHRVPVGMRWSEEFAIASGLMLSKANMDELELDTSDDSPYPHYDYQTESGTVTYYLLEPGHDYTIHEIVPEDEESWVTYDFDFVAPVYHPMLVDGKLKSVTFNKEGGQITGIGDISKEDWMVSLKIQNVLRGYINIEKKVVCPDGVTAKPDDTTKFTYIIDLNNDADPGPFIDDSIPWYGINGLYYHEHDEVNNSYLYYQAEVTNSETNKSHTLTLQTETGEVYEAWCVGTGEESGIDELDHESLLARLNNESYIFDEDVPGPTWITYRKLKEEVEEGEDEYEYITIKLFGNEMECSEEEVEVVTEGGETVMQTVASRNHVSAEFQISQDQILNLANIPQGTTYTIKEESQSGYSLVSIRKEIRNGDTVESRTSASGGDGEISGTIVPDRDNHFVFTNKIKTKDITVNKVDENNRPLSGAVFELKRVSHPAGLEESDYDNGISKPANGDADAGSYTFYDLPDGSYTLTEKTPPEGYTTISGSISFTKTDGVISEPSNLPAGVTWDDDTATFTVKNPESTDGKITVRKQWLDVEGNPTTYDGTLDLTLKQWVENTADNYTVTINFQYLTWGYNYSQTTNTFTTKTKEGAGPATISWEYLWGVNRESITVNGINSNEYSISGSNTSYSLSLDNVNRDMTINIGYSYNANSNPYRNVGDISIEQAVGEGYTCVDTRTIILGEGGDWSKQFTVSGSASMSDTNLPATYQGKTCYYTIEEPSVPGYVLDTTLSDDLSIPVTAGVIAAYNKKTESVSLGIKKIVQASNSQLAGGNMYRANGRYNFTVSRVTSEEPLETELVKYVQIRINNGAATYKVSGSPISNDDNSGFRWVYAEGAIVDDLIPGKYIVEESGYQLTNPDGFTMELAQIDVGGSGPNTVDLAGKTTMLTVTEGDLPTATSAFTNMLVPELDVPVVKTWNWSDTDSGNVVSWSATFNLEYREVLTSGEAVSDAESHWTQVYEADGTTPRRITITSQENPASGIFEDLPMYKAHTDEDGNISVYRLIYAVDEIAYTITPVNGEPKTWEKSTSGHLDQHYSPTYEQDAGELDQPTYATQWAEWYTIRLTNSESSKEIRKYIDLSLAKTWENDVDNSISEDPESYAKFQLMRYYHEESLDLTNRGLADKELVTVKLLQDTNTISELVVPIGAPVYVAGVVKPDKQVNMSFSDGTNTVALAGGSAASTARQYIVSNNFFTAAEDLTINLVSGDTGDLVGGVNGLRLASFDEGDIQNFQPDTAFNNYPAGQEFTLSAAHGWQKSWVDLPQIVEERTNSGDHVVLKTIVYSYYLVEKECHPDKFSAVFEDGLGNFSNPLISSTDIAVENRVSTTIVIQKIDETTRSNSTQTTISGARFRLLKYTGGTDGSGGSYSAYDATYGAQDGVLVGTDGSLTFNDLPNGEYQIDETGTPAGYIKIDNNNIYFNITNGVVTRYDKPVNYVPDSLDENDQGRTAIPATVSDDNEEATVIAGVSYMPDDEHAIATFIVGNTPGASLPYTGGPGTQLFTILGSILILGAGVLLWRRRKLI